SIQEKRLEKLRKERDEGEVRTALNDIKMAAESGDNLMPYTIKSAKAKVTIGEVSKTLRQVFGVWSPSFI
ncbi:MAG: methylmalonyl-CoA mutase, partial [Deltaproteobacteria bacterium]|nr:methylmalonyl-CoA mutase [Deltaproteobacteria bacterium]